jgi:hypothetical protein
METISVEQVWDALIELVDEMKEGLQLTAPSAKESEERRQGNGH